MKKIHFENASLFFDDFPVGILSGEIDIYGTAEWAFIEKIKRKNYAQIQAQDIILRLPLKERSEQFSALLATEPAKPNLKHLITKFGTLSIKTCDGSLINISEVFWTRFPATEFQLRHDPENTIHSVCFLW